jgi:hypothetical protein
MNVLPECVDECMLYECLYYVKPNKKFKEEEGIPRGEEAWDWDAENIPLEVIGRQVPLRLEYQGYHIAG